MNILKILGGVLILFLGFYVMYLGSVSGSTFIFMGGILIAFLGSIVIYIYRYRENMKLIYRYRKAIEELKKDPENQELIENAYKYGKEFYKSRSPDGMLNSKLKKALDMDIQYTRGKLDQ